ncbi:MAG: DUF1822 family protein [Coleofasciculus sp.]|uniref:DUF1822 family protein n=1 Tax=Coleofasciculus sp. TaxID=3100458 RepID=UPI003A30DDA8
MMTSVELLLKNALPMPIMPKIIQMAQGLAQKQPTAEKAEQVYLNTLAVWAVRDYLELMEIDTDIEHSDFANPVVCLGADVADLKVKGLGTLECRPVKVFENHSGSENNRWIPEFGSIPPEVWQERIGYVFVAIDPQRKESRLLGFTQTAGTGQVFLPQLQPLAALLEYLDQLTNPIVNLNQWFANQFAAGWQQLEELWDTDSELSMSRQNVPAFRRFGTEVQLFPDADIMRAKLIDFGMELGTQRLALVMALTQESDRKVSVFVQVHPTGGDRYLPGNLTLALLSDSGDRLQAVQSRGLDLWVQLRQFRVEPGTNFGLQVVLDGVSITESFTL